MKVKLIYFAKDCTFSQYIMCFWYVHSFFSSHFCEGSFFTERYFGFPAKEESQYQVQPSMSFWRVLDKVSSAVIRISDIIYIYIPWTLVDTELLKSVQSDCIFVDVLKPTTSKRQLYSSLLNSIHVSGVKVLLCSLALFSTPNTTSSAYKIKKLFKM